MRKDKRTKFIRTFVVLLAVLSLASVSAFADDDTYSIGTIQNAATETLTTIYKVILTVVAPLSAVSLAWLGYKFLFGDAKDGRLMLNAKRYLATLLFADAVVLLAPVIIRAISSWFTGSISAVFENIRESTTAATPTAWFHYVANVDATIEEILSVLYVVYPIASMLAAVSLASAGLKMVLNLPLGCTEKQLERAKAQAILSAAAFAVLLLLPKVCQAAVAIGIRYAWEPTAFRL